MNSHSTLEAPASALPRSCGSRLQLLALSFTLVLAACGGGGNETASVAPSPPPPSGRPASVERTVLPATADPTVTTALQAHVAINPSASVAPANKLFVFLPGTTGEPDQYELILRSGAARGYHTLGLNYPNAEAVGVTCMAHGTDCFWEVRREVITGSNSSALVNVGVSDSIVTRLSKAITYLHANHSTEGWGQYLSSPGVVDWSKIVIAGHSQGGGHAGVMTKLYNMNRAVYFSSPPDWSGSAPAAWTSMANVTPASRQYAFTHTGDTLVSYSDLTAIWLAMGLSALGAPVSVDSNTAPYGSAHILTTNETPNTAGASISPTHGAPVLDAATPTTGGVPDYTAAWAYLCFPV